MSTPADTTSLAKTYLHIGNSGLTVEVLDGEHGPTFQTTFSTFGHPAVTIVHTSVEALREIGEMLLSVANSGHKWGKEYCCVARLSLSQRYGQEEVHFGRTGEGSISDYAEADEVSKEAPL